MFDIDCKGNTRCKLVAIVALSKLIGNFLGSLQKKLTLNLDLLFDLKYRPWDTDERPIFI
jgi:hypothetical protein